MNEFSGVNFEAPDRNEIFCIYQQFEIEKIDNTNTFDLHKKLSFCSNVSSLGKQSKSPNKWKIRRCQQVVLV